MKKILVIMIFMVSLLVSGCGNKLTTFEQVNYDKIESMVENKESFVLFIGSTECPHCDLYKETLNEVIKKYQVKIYYIDIYGLSAEEGSKLKAIANYTGTPTTVFIENGEETSMYDRIDGNKPMSKVVEKLKKKGYIE